MVVRADLPRGIQAANIVHAAGESAPGGLPSGTHAVVLQVPDERDLWRLADKLDAYGVAFVKVDEPDPPYGGALMAIGLHPRRKEEVRRYLSSLPLLK